MRITGIISDKGGDTKSTTTNALATGINYLYPDKKALAITNEPSGHLPFFFGLNPEDHQTLYHVGKGEIAFPDVIQHTDRGDLINGNRTLKWIDELWATPEEKLRIYSLVKNGLNEYRIKQTYTHGIIDCKPLTEGTLTIQSLIACTDVIVPMKASAASILSLMNLHKGLEEIKAAYNPKLKIAGILITRYRHNTFERGHLENLKLWARINGTKVYDTIIPDGVGIEEMQGMSKDIYRSKYDKKGKDKPAKAYLEFVKEYLADER
jgi:chromosome partitioning protein